MHLFRCRVYYEDTDVGGVVYYANYLRFIERARTEWAREAGVDQVRLREEGVVFAVRRIEADYLVPARFDDLLDVRTTLQGGTVARLVLWQEIGRESQLLFTARVTLVALDMAGRPRRIPAGLRHGTA
jgi:acyl-CoA thioester hydrolase